MLKKSEKLDNKIKEFNEKINHGFLEKELGEGLHLTGAASFLLGAIGALNYFESLNHPAPPGYPFNNVLQHFSDYQLIYFGVGVGTVLLGNYLYNKGLSKEKDNLK